MPKHTSLAISEALHQSHSYNYIMKLLIAIFTPLLLCACDSEGLGGSAGDSGANPEAVQLVAPFEGLYDLPDNWRGDAPNEAFLQIDAPNEQGQAQATLIDIDDIDQCVPTRPSQGDVFKDPSSERIFMDGLIDFPDAVISLSGSTLVIELQDDPQDLDMDTITNETVELPSPSFSGDLPDDC